MKENDKKGAVSRVLKKGKDISRWKHLKTNLCAL